MAANVRRQQSSPQETSDKIEVVREDKNVLFQVDAIKKLHLNHSNQYCVRRRSTQKSPKKALGGMVGSTIKLKRDPLEGDDHFKPVTDFLKFKWLPIHFLLDTAVRLNFCQRLSRF